MRRTACPRERHSDAFLRTSRSRRRPPATKRWSVRLDAEDAASISRTRTGTLQSRRSDVVVAKTGGRCGMDLLRAALRVHRSGFRAPKLLRRFPGQLPLLD